MSTTEKDQLGEAGAHTEEGKTPYERFCADFAALRRKVRKWERAFKYMPADASQATINEMLMNGGME